MTRAAEALWHGRAFGLDLESDFAVEGRCAAAKRVRQRPVRLKLARAEGLRQSWPEGGERISDRVFEDGSPAISIDRHPDAGFLFQAAGWGSYRVAADAGTIECGPTDIPHWQRFLIGQALPFTALLHGLEVFHAGAVAVNGGAVVFSGPSTAGKSSATVGLALRGHGFVADDVVSVEPTATELLAHPGVGAASVRLSTAEALGSALEEGGAEILGRDDEAVRVALVPEPDPLPIAALYLLDPDAPFKIEALSPVSPQLLLGATFNFVLRTPERLVNQLDLCARIAAEVPIYRVGVSGPPPVRRLVDELYSHVIS